MANPHSVLLQIDCEAYAKTCEKHGVDGYPTLKVWKNGILNGQYSGEKKAGKVYGKLWLVVPCSPVYSLLPMFLSSCVRLFVV